MFRLAALVVVLVTVVGGAVIPGDGIRLHKLHDESPGVGAVIAGKCPVFTTQEAFSIDSYEGRWFEIQRMANLFEEAIKCVTSDYTKKVNNSMAVLNSGQLVLINQPVGILATATPRNASGSFDLHFPYHLPTGEYNVLSTDYKTYSAVYSCQQLKFDLTLQTAWVLGRNPTMTDEVLVEVWKVFTDLGINTLDFEKTTQDDSCIYY